MDEASALNDRYAKYNRTIDWLLNSGRSHLARAAIDGVISVLTAFESAVDPRPLNVRLAEWDACRKAFQ